MQGFDQYEKLYADAKLWLNKGWLDYWTPQLYWKLSAPAQPYEPLLNWWISENTQGRHIWPGLFTSKIGDRPTAVADPGRAEPGVGHAGHARRQRPRSLQHEGDHAEPRRHRRRAAATARTASRRSSRPRRGSTTRRPPRRAT